jgi:hypothetical protein
VLELDNGLAFSLNYAVSPVFWGTEFELGYAHLAFFDIGYLFLRGGYR